MPGAPVTPPEAWDKDRHTLLPPHRTISAWYHFAQETLRCAPEVELNSLYSCPAAWKFASRYGQGQEGSFLQKSRTRPHGFREVSSFPDEVAVKRALKSALTLQPKEVSVVNQNIHSGVAASLYSAHFLEGAALKASQASGLLTSLPNSVKLTSRSDLEAQLWLALSSVEDTKSFLSHGQATQSDALGPLTVIDVDLTLASQDRFLTCLRPYLALWHRATLRYSDLMSESLMRALQEVIVASREDATHESTCQVTNLGLSQDRRPSSHGPPWPRGFLRGATRGHGSCAMGNCPSGHKYIPSRRKSGNSGNGSHGNHRPQHGCGCGRGGTTRNATPR